MQLFHGRSRRLPRLMTTLGLGAATAIAISCSDRASGPAGIHEGVPASASLSLTPTYVALPAGGPTIVLGSVQGVLTRSSGDKTTVNSNVVGETANLDFALQVSGGSDDFTLDVSAYDADGIIAFAYTGPLTLRSGSNDNVADPLLAYAGPDKNVTRLQLSPRTIALGSASVTIGTTGLDAAGQSITPLRVGWTSRNPAIASVDSKGVVRLGTTFGSTYIVGRTATNAADSVQVTVHGPVDKIVVSPAAPQVIRGQTVALLGQLFDASNTLITDQSPAWSTSDASIATMSSTGVITGVKLGLATISATANGKTGSAVVEVVTPLDHIELTPPNLILSSIGQKAPLTAKLVAKTGASVTGMTPTFESANPAAATVDQNGVVTAVANGSSKITASADGVSASMNVTVAQSAGSIVVSPKSASVTNLSEQRAFTATVLDASGNPIAQPTIVWTSSDPLIAVVNSEGLTTALSAGRVTITATSGGKSDEAQFIVAPIAKMLVVSSNKSSIPVGGKAVVKAKYADANGNSLGDAIAEWSTTTPAVASVASTGEVVGLSGGTAHIVASASGLTGSIDIRVNGQSGGGGLVLNVTSIEKLPKGTQQLFVVSGGSGPFTWTVNGIPNGNDIFGTLTSIEGGVLYTAPALVPNPASFDICANQASPPLSGCVHVTISPIPSGGADVIVFNDDNMFDNTYGGPYANNIQLFKNLVNFTAEGTRASQTGVLFFHGHKSGCGGYLDNECTSGPYSMFYNTITEAGFTISEVNDLNATITSIDPTIKVIFLMMPEAMFAPAEINVLKEFAGQGGRIVYVGERQPFLGATGIAVENNFFLQMGALMRNVGGDYACIYQMDASHVHPHQVTAGLTGISMACVSEVQLGPNDYALVTDQYNENVVLAAVAKIDLTPIPIQQNNVIRAQTLPALTSSQKAGLPAAGVTGVDPTKVKKP